MLQTIIVISVMYWISVAPRSISAEDLLTLSASIRSRCAEQQSRNGLKRVVVWRIDETKSSSSWKDSQRNFTIIHNSQQSCGVDAQQITLWQTTPVSSNKSPTLGILQFHGASSITVQLYDFDNALQDPTCVFVRSQNRHIRCTKVPIEWISEKRNICKLLEHSVAEVEAIASSQCGVAADELELVALRALLDSTIKLPEFVLTRAQRAASFAYIGLFAEAAEEAQYVSHHADVSYDSHIPLEQKGALLATLLVPFAAGIVGATVEAVKTLRQYSM